MKKLEEIRARAEKATEGPWRVGGSGIVADREYVVLGVRTDPDAEFIAHSRTDVVKLVAALEAVEACLSEQASGYRETAERLNRMVIDQDPDRDVDGAARYSHYASAWEAAQRTTERIIQEALQ